MKVNNKELAYLLQTTDPGLSQWFYLSVYEFAAEKKPSDCDHYVRRWVLLVNNVLLTSKNERGKSGIFVVLYTVITNYIFSVYFC